MKLQKLEGTNYFLTALMAAVFILLCYQFKPEAIPFTFFQFWKLDIPVGDLLGSSWLLFAWGIIINLVVYTFKGVDAWDSRDAESIFLVGGILSLVAGIFEEISYRWLIFYAEIASLQFLNFLLFGFMGFNLVEWLYTAILIPVANFLSFGALQPYLFNPVGWFIGAAVVSSNGDFRDGHKYQGIFGLINSWFIGMYFFYLMFHFGLIAAMIIHTIYDLLIDATVYLCNVFNRWLDN